MNKKTQRILQLMAVRGHRNGFDGGRTDAGSDRASSNPRSR